MHPRPLAATLVGLALLAAGCTTGPDRHAGPGATGPSPTRAALDAMDPDARAVAERVVRFVGGAEALDGVRTMEVRFEGESDGNPIAFHLAWSRSDAGWHFMQLGPDAGVMGTDGEAFWYQDEGEQAELYEIDPDEQFGMREQADQVLEFVSFPLDVVNPSGSHAAPAQPMHAHGEDEFKGQRASVLSPIAAPGPEDAMFWHYYDPQTGRPLGVTQGLPSEPLYMAFSDWREVEGGSGLKMFHRVTVDGFWLGSEVFDLRASFVRVNTLDESDFEPPADAVLQTDG
ncbi:MAG: hypothetical protein RIE77_07380 [Phycisphaerales bacterium]|jgi:hypothetical protein